MYYARKINFRRYSVQASVVPCFGFYILMTHKNKRLGIPRLAAVYSPREHSVQTGAQRKILGEFLENYRNGMCDSLGDIGDM